jgi:5,10-methylenetetrahydromethanopterin reductase
LSLFESVGVGFEEYGNWHEFLNLVRLTDKANFSSLWIQEGNQRSALTLAALALNSTVRVKVGVGVTSPLRRHPQILAIEGATLNEISNGRFILGLGVASSAITNYGLETRPVHAMRDTFRIIRGLLSNESSQFSYSGEEFSLNAPQKRLMMPSIPVYLGGIGPQMLGLAGEVADGLVLTRRGSFSVEYAKYAIERAIRSARKHGRDPGKIDFLAFFETCISEHENSAVQFAKRILGSYTIPETPRFVSNLAGIQEHDILAVKEKYFKGDLPGAISAVTDEMVDKFAVAGTPSQCLEKVAKFSRTGLKTPILYIHGPDKRTAAKLAAEHIVPNLTQVSAKGKRP